jgi:hypothetical protein
MHSLSARPSFLSSVHIKQIENRWMDCNKILYLGIFNKSFDTSQVFINIRKRMTDIYYTRFCLYAISNSLNIYRSGKILQTNAVDRHKTYTLCPIQFLFVLRFPWKLKTKINAASTSQNFAIQYWAAEAVTEQCIHSYLSSFPNCNQSFFCDRIAPFQLNIKIIP